MPNRLSRGKVLVGTIVGDIQAAAGSIGTAEIADSAVEAAKIASGAVTEAKVAAGAVTEAKLEAATGAGLYVPRVARVEVDLSDGGGGGTAGAYANETVALGVTIPDNAIVIGGALDVTTALDDVDADGDVTMAIQVEGSTDILAATAASALTTGIKAITPVFTAATMKKTTQARAISLVFGNQDGADGIDTGVFTLVLVYVIGDEN